MTGPERPQRVVVTGPREPAGRSRPVPLPADLHRHTEVGEVYLRSLIRAQLRFGVLVCGALLGPLLALPLVFVWVPGISSVHVFGIGLPWLLLGVGIYPALLGGALWYVRHVERDERNFVRLVGEK